MQIRTPFLFAQAVLRRQDDAMRCALTLFYLALLSATAADADAGPLARLEGIYGDATDEELSCTANPHRVSFVQNPPHAILEWQDAWVMTGGLLSDRAVYDLVQVTGSGVLMRLEGEHRRTDAGQRVIWIMRPDPDDLGYCWGRTDWPLIRCVNPQVRCTEDKPVS